MPAVCSFPYGAGSRATHARAREHRLGEPRRGRGPVDYVVARHAGSPVYDEDTVLARQRRRRAARAARGPLRHGARAGEPARPDRGRRRGRARRERHEGRRRRDDRARPRRASSGSASSSSAGGAGRRTRARCRALRAASASTSTSSIVLEPTDNTIQAGCLGNLNARLVFRGVSAHSARPWTGENAIAAAVRGLAPILALEPEPGRGRGPRVRRGAERDADPRRNRRRT